MKIKVKQEVWAIIIFLMAFLSITIRYNVLTEKFFYDSINILKIERSGNFYEGSFHRAAKFYYLINIFEIDSLMEWTLFLSPFCGIICYLFIKRIRVIKLVNFVYIITAIFLWMLFSIGITKEFLQWIFFMVVYAFSVIKFKDLNVFVNVALMSIILLISAFVFREYYVLIAFFVVATHLFFTTLIRLNINDIYTIVFCFCLLILTFFSCLRIIFPNQYEVIVNLRSITYQYLVLDTDSFISDLIPNYSQSVLIYTINYLINFLRLLIPLELIIKGKIYYYPFFIYQVWFLHIYIRNLTKLDLQDFRRYLSTVILSSFLIVSAIMEPDFGSLVRHQSVCWMFYIYLIDY